MTDAAREPTLLLACAHCDGPATEELTVTEYRVQCGHRSACGAVIIGTERDVEAVRVAWNRREPSEAASKRLAEIAGQVIAAHTMTRLMVFLGERKRLDQLHGTPGVSWGTDAPKERT